MGEPPYRVYRRIARQWEHQGFILVVSSGLALVAGALVILALFLDTPQVYLIDGASSVQTLILRWF